MTAETAMLLTRVLKTSSQYWMHRTVAVDLYEAEQHLEHTAWPARLTYCQATSDSI